MSGASVVIKVTDSNALAYLSVLKRHLGTLYEPLRDIGEHLVNTTRERFSHEMSPAGHPWAPLSPATVEWKTGIGKNPDKILTMYGDMRGGIAYRVDVDELAVGSDKEYAAIHQFGGLAGRGMATSSRSGGSAGGVFIPARPFLGLSEEDEAEILEIVKEYFRD